jgi:hypothetical protein
MAPVEDDLKRSAGDITAGDKYEFLQLIRQGLDRREAARALGFTARPWRALTSPLSPFYDEDFTNAYADSKGSPESKMHYVERLREEVRRRAFTDSDALLKTEAMVHLPEYDVLRQKNVNVNVRAIFEQRLKMLPTDLLQQVLERLEGRAPEEIEDAEYRELLPPAGDDVGGNGDGSE